MNRKAFRIVFTKACAN